jgi:hypothetical protein
MLEILAEASSTVFTNYSELASYVILTLVGAVGIMWTIVQSKSKSVEKRLSEQIEFGKEAVEESKAALKECYDSNHLKDESLLSLTGRVGKLEGRLEGHEQAREDIKEMSENYAKVLNFLPK